MGYKFKPNKAVKKRFKVTKTGKLKRHHAFTSHLMSARPAKTRRKLRRSAILFEGLARNMRQLMGISHLKPGQIEHERAQKAAAGNGAELAAKTPAATKVPPASRESKATKKAPARAGAAKPRA